MVAVLPIMLQMAIAAERLTSGRGKEFATHDTMIWSGGKLVNGAGEVGQVDLQEDTAPIGMRNMAKKRAPTTVVPAAIAFPTAASSMRQTMCKDLSFVFAELNVTQMERRKVANYWAVNKQTR
jgi:hypothetical protein